LVVKPWIDKYQTWIKEEESLEYKNHELKYFMTRRIAQFLE
jgi:hypothetical protein